MLQEDIIYFDIAAVVVMSVSLLSYLMRKLTQRPATRVYFASMVLVFLLSKPISAYQLGEAYAQSMGVNTRELGNGASRRGFLSVTR